MTTPKEKVVASIKNASADLQKALAELENLPAVDPDAVAFAAHALNNYLTVTAGTVELLMIRMLQHPDEQIQVWLEGLAHATNLMTHTAGQLLNASVARDPKLMLGSVDLYLLIRRACGYYHGLASPKEIQVICGPEPTASDAWTDRVAVAAVLDNLLSNAVKFSAPGTSVHVNLAAEPDRLVCSVQDQGPGLSSEEQERLFQKGVRLSAVPTAGEPSSGYGLAVAKELITRLGGGIWCRSTPGEGACFFFSVPTRPGSETPQR